LDHEPTTEKQDRRHVVTTGHVAEAAISEPAGQSMSIGGLASGDGFAAMSAGDGGSRARVLTHLQQTAGNGAAAVVAASDGARRLQRSESPGVDTVMLSPDVDTTYNVTEAIGPVAGSSYTVTADSLASFASAVAARDEAGRVQWDPTFDYDSEGGDAPSVTVSVACPIGLEMPSWALLEDMGPRTRAEFNRWLAALGTHEQGHIDRVHLHFDGLAERMARLSFTAAQGLFNTTKTDLQTASDAYDASTAHGISQGTTLDLSIEEDERAEDEEEGSE
jgi:hypothetical protein